VQAETLSKILSEMVTREYLEAQLAGIRSQLASMKGELGVVNKRLDRMATKEELAREMAKLTRLILIAMGVFATFVGMLSRIG